MLCFSYPIAVNYNPDEALPVYQDEMPQFAAYFQKVYKSFMKGTGGVLAPHQFMLVLHNLVADGKSHLPAATSQKKGRARLDIMLYDSSKGIYEVLETWQYAYSGRKKSRGKSVEDMIVGAFRKCYAAEIEQMEERNYMEALKAFYNSRNFAERVVLRYFMGEDTRHTIVHTTRDIKNGNITTSLNNGSVSDAVKSLLESSFSANGTVYPALNSWWLDGDFGEFEVFGFDRPYRHKATIPERPEPTLQDLGFLSDKAWEHCLQTFAFRASTSQARWDILNILVACDNKSAIVRFAKSTSGEWFLNHLEGDEREFAGMYFDQIDGCKKLGKSMMAKG